ncbi:4-diphosphocytidyl-2-C-methyl-D-erythritol kinase (CMK) [Candidatus Glomeribacter gigasporarum BEG34]|uniref:4-diphosphocytidyl-2-C-methyl-D-erythritol kinase n=1 Tax=Candidatus Glomeribacter gigasporarum BEG34 TaxID=1070319 RepID=G2JAI2_9BURK|nr:4-(cytidine 5'-diphospho)-2-C-methyl-D-erythritol kinase [Candidatus Glomeribacter gigasporarum]CCD29784.1 4-diphosphocytidyl-2-C-methyl-D-erythritol kinase (CMK) [Candidatus Glomeribacter gigasporarum BEG34]
MTEMTPHLSCLAPAKLNLFLHITGRRPDGYHTLQTVFQLLDYGDTLHFRVRDDAVIRRATASLEVPEENDLAIRAARLLQTQSRCPLGVEIGIDKRVPIGAGLGGGSSDAACVLLALNRLWRLNLPRVQLQRLALSLGADVPFFVFGRNAFAEGIGERLHAIDLPNRYFLIVTPDVQAASADIFAAPELTRNTKIIKIADFLEQRRNPLWPDHFGRNDMQPLVAQKYAEVAHLLDRFGRIAPARMTGTGSSVFAAFKDKERADSVQSKLPQGMHSIVASGLAIHPLFTFSY